MYLTMSPLIAGGIANMLFTKTALYRKYQTPMDQGRCLPDGSRLLGDNKTWIGFGSMVFFCMVFQVLCGWLCNHFGLNEMNDLYRNNPNTPWFNALFGSSMGFVYMLCELPNSFIKRRLGITPGKTGTGWIGIVFFLIDQVDSLLGVMLVLLVAADISIAKYAAYVLLGGVTHIGVNLLLYGAKVRKNL
jgi:hypothetical protein